MTTKKKLLSARNIYTIPIPNLTTINSPNMQKCIVACFYILVIALVIGIFIADLTLHYNITESQHVNFVGVRPYQGDSDLGYIATYHLLTGLDALKMQVFSLDRECLDSDNMMVEFEKKHLTISGFPRQYFLSFWFGFLLCTGIKMFTVTEEDDDEDDDDTLTDADAYKKFMESPEEEESVHGAQTCCPDDPEAQAPSCNTATSEPLLTLEMRR